MTLKVDLDYLRARDGKLDWNKLAQLRNAKSNGATLVLTTPETPSEEWLIKTGLTDLFDQIYLGVVDPGVPEEAIKYGIKTKKDWLKFLKSAHFVSAVKNYKGNRNVIHLPLDLG